VTDAENDLTVQPAPANTKTRPLLTPALMARLRAYGSPERVGAGDLIYQLGDDNYDLILIESGRVDLLCDPATGQAPSLIAEMGPGDFLGEISLFTGERMFITACAREATAIHRIGAEAFRQLMAQDAELSDLILTALYHRRDLLKTALAGTIEFLGQKNSAAALALVAYAERMELPHKWTDADTHRGASLRRSLELEPADLPTALLPDAVLVNATPSQLARHLAMSPSRIRRRLRQVAGLPAGHRPGQGRGPVPQHGGPLVKKLAPTADPRGLSYRDAIVGTIQALYSPRFWRPLTVGLTKLKNGHGDTLLALADMYMKRDEQGHYDNQEDAHSAINCVDEPPVTDRARAVEADRQLRKVAPFVSYGEFTGHAPLGTCAFWPAPPTSEPHPISVQGLPPVLVVSTTHDPATPYQAGVGLARQIGGVLLSFDGTQHTVVFEGDA
jgi:CRP-like cAMP-binding protein